MDIYFTFAKWINTLQVYKILWAISSVSWKLDELAADSDNFLKRNLWKYVFGAILRIASNWIKEDFLIKSRIYTINTTEALVNQNITLARKSFLLIL